MLKYKLNINAMGRFLLTQRIIFILIAVAFIIRIPTLFVRYFDPDEFEHLHAARNIYLGMVPYKDYFEHHTPFFHFFLASLNIFLKDKIELFFLARFVMLIFTCGILYLTHRIAKLLHGVNVALYAVVFLSYVKMFNEKTIEIRPDVPGVIFWLLSLFFFITGIIREKQYPHNRRRYFFLAGIMMASAILTTQKAIFCMIGLLMAWTYMQFDKRIGLTLREGFDSLAWFGLGLSVPFSVTCAYFLLNNALGEFIYRNFIMNLYWKERFLPYEYILQIIKQNTFFSVFGLAGMIIVVFHLCQKGKILKGRFVLLFSLLVLIAGLFLIRIPYRQYYLFLFPLLAIYSGFIFDIIIRYFSWKQLRKFWLKQKYLYFYFLSVLFAAILITTSYIIGWSKLFTLTVRDIPNFYLWIGLFLTPFLIWSFINGRRQYFALVLMMGIIVYPFKLMLDDFLSKDFHLKYSNKAKLDEIRFVLQNTSLDDTVFDSWSGSGVFRNHAYYYWFLHNEIQKMLTIKERSDNILNALKAKRPKIVIYDSFTQLLPLQVKSYITKNYRPAGIGDIYILKYQ